MAVPGAFRDSTIRMEPCVGLPQDVTGTCVERIEELQNNPDIEGFAIGRGTPPRPGMTSDDPDEVLLLYTTASKYNAEFVHRVLKTRFKGTRGCRSEASVRDTRSEPTGAQCVYVSIWTTSGPPTTVPGSG